MPSDLKISKVWIVGNTLATFSRSMSEGFINYNLVDYKFKQWAISTKALFIKIVFVSKSFFFTSQQIGSDQDWVLIFRIFC